MRYAVLFPGQGSQAVGMGADVFAMRPDLLGSAADEVLGWSLAALCAEGPDDELVRTDRAQPALYGVEYALWEAFAVRAPHLPMAAAGHSLGEYTALAASGALPYRDGLRLVAARGRAMAKATAGAPGTMAAVIGTDLEAVESVVASMRDEGAAIWVANINAPGQVVVAGADAAVAAVVANGRDLGLRRVIPINVAGAFHTPMMEAACPDFNEALAEADFADGAFPVWSSLTAEPAADVTAVLAGQLVAPVRFSNSLLAMAEAGVEAFVHIGPGDVTAGMARRTVKGTTAITVSSLADIGAAVSKLAVV